MATDTPDDWRREAEGLAAAYYLLVLADTESERADALDRMKQGAQTVAQMVGKASA